MKVFVTGASGFIGSYVCRDLAAAGHEILALSREASPWRLADVRDQITLVRGGLEDPEVWGEQLTAFQPQAVAHLGWMGVGNFDRNNLHQVKNVGWTTDLVERSARSGARVFVGVGSQAEYGSRAVNGGPEIPTTVYGESKLAAGRLSAIMSQQLEMRFAWMRVFSTFGPMDHPYWMIPSLIRDLLRRSKPALTEGHQKWDFLFVADAARAIRTVLESESASGVYPLGSGEAPQLRSTIEALRDEIDPKLALGFGAVPYRPDQVMHLQADVTRLKDLGWQPEKSLRQGLVDTVDWYRSNGWIFE
jgi:nucleoside-diphosphate-sugar epimerase